jgi:hypothetical protein
MSSEAQNIIAFVFKRSGKKEMSYSDFYLTLSVDLKWFTPKDAKAFTNQIVKQKLLKKKEENVKPAFEINKIEVPLGFYPSKQILEQKESNSKIKEKDIFTDIVNEIISKTGKKEEEILEKIKSTEKEKNITKEIAAILVGKDFGISSNNYFDEVEEKIFK